MYADVPGDINYSKDNCVYVLVCIHNIVGQCLQQICQQLDTPKFWNVTKTVLVSSTSKLSFAQCYYASAEVTVRRLGWHSCQQESWILLANVIFDLLVNVQKS